MYYCKKCNGTNIDVKAWVNQVTNNIEYSDYYENQDVYCLDCEESFGVYFPPFSINLKLKQHENKRRKN